MIVIALLGFLFGAASLIHSAWLARQLKRLQPSDRASQADLDEMRKHVIEYANAMNLLAAEIGHSSVTPPTGEYRSSQSYNRG
jgi:hypothetical protein